MIVYHQNIRGLKHKTNELLRALCPDFPHILCLTEHHLNSLELNNITIDHYNLGAVYCRKSLSKGGVCIFVYKSLNFININLDKFCLDQVIEVCAVKLQSALRNICIVAVYRAPSGNFMQFLNGLDAVLKTVFSSGIEFIVCGDININYLNDSLRKKQLDTLLLSFNLSSTIDFPTRSQKNSVSLIDNIFIDHSQLSKHGVYPVQWIVRSQCSTLNY